MTDLELMIKLESIDTMKYKKDLIKVIRKMYDNINSKRYNDKNRNLLELQHFIIMSKAYSKQTNLVLPDKINNKYNELKVKILNQMIEDNKSIDEINNVFRFEIYIKTYSNYYRLIDIENIEKLFLICENKKLNFNIDIYYKLNKYFTVYFEDNNINILIFLEYLKVKHKSKKIALLEEEIIKYKQKIKNKSSSSKIKEFEDITNKSNITNKAINKINKYIGDLI